MEFNSVAEVWGYLPGVLVLLAVSSFFSGSEAAFFSLTPLQKRSLSTGNPSERLAYRLLRRSERLLMGILFWNLAINIGYFSVVSKISLELSANATQSTGNGDTHAALVSIAALLMIIVFGEFLPKSLAVTYPVRIVRLVAVPLALAVRIIDVVFPALRFANEMSRRMIWPGFKSEAYLEIEDLDRAIELSTDDAQLYEQESQVLRNVIRLSEIRAEEWMRPRTQYRSFTPPLSLSQLEGERTPSGYMLVTDSQGRDVTSVIALDALHPQHPVNLEQQREPVVVVPWCASIADALRRLRDQGRRVAAVVNEFGDTIGILTWEQIMEAVLQAESVPALPELSTADIRAEGETSWLVTGLAKVRRLERVLGRRLRTQRGLTIAGVIQEQLHRMPEVGDQCDLDGFHVEVLQAGQRGEILVRIRSPHDTVEGAS